MALQVYICVHVAEQSGRISHARIYIVFSEIQRKKKKGLKYSAAPPLAACIAYASLNVQNVKVNSFQMSILRFYPARLHILIYTMNCCVADSVRQPFMHEIFTLIP